VPDNQPPNGKNETPGLDPDQFPTPAIEYDEREIKAEQVARSLSKFFYEQGSFTAVASFYPNYEPPLTPAGHYIDDKPLKLEPEFGGLSVQAVGFELGKAENAAVHVYLTKAQRALEKKLPTEVDGIPLKLSRMGRLMVCPGPFGGSNFFERDGRACCGSSSAPSSEQYAGTLGCLVRIADDPDAIYALSNNHVFAACNHTPVGQPIMSPANMDSGPNQAPRHVANHSRIVELRSGVVELVRVNQADLAFAKLVGNDVVSSWQGDPVHGYDTHLAFCLRVAAWRLKSLGGQADIPPGPWKP
jgi:hypothetical protein